MGALCAPMETIFVRSVAEDSPAEKAGLQCGDRLVAVNGQPLSGLSYQQTVQLIQHSPPYLHLLVVPQKDDVLQKVIIFIINICSKYRFGVLLPPALNWQ